MQFIILTVGKLKEGYLREGVELYLKRLKPYGNFSLKEVKDEHPKSGADEEALKKREGERLLAAVPPGAYIVALDTRGRQMTSPRLSGWLRQKERDAVSRLAFIIGGHWGLAPEILTRADFTLSLSEMTFPHELSLLILLEQLYRAESILHGHPYHRE